jgi:hypothetical protein
MSGSLPSESRWIGVRRAGTVTRGCEGGAEGFADGLRVANEGDAAGGWWTTGAGAGRALLVGASDVGLGAGVLGVGVGGGVGVGLGGTGGGGVCGTHQQ